MKTKQTIVTETLRQKAEKLLIKQKSNESSTISEADALKLVHELEVHQIELEMQNEELILAKQQADIATFKFADLYDFAPSGYISLSNEGVIIELNFSSARMLGNDRSHLKNSLLTHYISIETRTIFDIFLTYVFKSQTKQTCEVVLSTNGNMPINVHIEGIVIETESVCFLTLIDITKQKKAELALIENNLRLKSLIRIFQFNAPTIQDLLDFTLQETLALTNSKIGYIFFYNKDNQMFTHQAWSKKVLKDCAIKESNTEFHLDKTGIWGEAVRQRKPIMVNNFRQPNDLKKGCPKGHIELHNFLTIPVIIDTEIVAVIGVANKSTNYTETDILHLTLLMDNTWKTIEKKNITELVQIKNAELVKHNKDNDLFMSILAHDLRSPFNSILGLLQLLTKKIRVYDIEKTERTVQIVYESANRAYNLLDDLLSWGRSQMGKLPFEPENLNFLTICADIVASVQQTADSKNITIKYFAAADMKMFADKNMVYSLLRNLISNAIKFTNIGGHINVYAKQDTTNLTITVSDNGVGFLPKILENLFDITHVYSNVGTANEKGTGLGLLLCKEFVERHSGKIWIKSEVDKGTEIMFTLKQ